MSKVTRYTWTEESYPPDGMELVAAADYDALAADLARATAELAEARSERLVMSESGWLIEDSDRSRAPQWLRIVRQYGTGYKVEWTSHASCALRFAREQDARDFWMLCPQPGVIPMITEHAWDDIEREEVPGKGQ